MKKRMNLNKKGISLTILVITLIIISILAGIITVKLTDIKIMGNANDNANKINLNQVKSLATIAWTEAYMSGNIRTSEQYEEHIKKELSDSGVNLGDYEISADKNGVTITLSGELLPEEPEGPTDIVDNAKPTVEIVLNQVNVPKGGTIIFTLIFDDNKEIAVIDLALDDIVLNGFTATKEISGEGYMKVVTLSNVQGELGNKTITINEGVVTDGSDNRSDAVTSQQFVLETELTRLGDLITSADDYGKTINYVSDNGVDKWKIFYEKDDYVFIIASEKLEYDKVPQKFKDAVNPTIDKVTLKLENGSEIEVANVYWTAQNLPQNVATLNEPAKFMGNWGEYGSYSTNINGRLASYFLAEDYWTEFENSTASYRNYVRGAIGTPTAEMFAASWNAKRVKALERNDEETYNMKFYVWTKLPNGYQIIDVEPGTNTTTYQYISLIDDLYIWSTLENSGIWLASPAATDVDQLLRARNDGQLGSNVYTKETFGLRPVVCLSGDVPAKANGTQGYILD